MSSWYKENNGIVVSSRIRLARNISDLPFSSKMNNQQLDELKTKVKCAICDSNTPFANTLKYIEMCTIPHNIVVLLFLESCFPKTKL